MFSMIMEYLDVNKIDQGMLLAGYLGENLIYEKGEKENGRTNFINLRRNNRNR